MTTTPTFPLERSKASSDLLQVPKTRLTEQEVKEVQSKLSKIRWAKEEGAGASEATCLADETARRTQEMVDRYGVGDTRAQADRESMEAYSKALREG